MYFQRITKKKISKLLIEEFLDNEYVDDVIVVDNNSTDNTKNEIQKTKAIYFFEEKPGYGSALSRGLIESDGDIIKLLVYSEDYEKCVRSDQRII